MNDRLIFYHVPKTGGIWALATMSTRRGMLGLSRAPRKRGVRPLGLWGQHSTPEAMEDAYRADRFEFCFVRRPLEWYRSFWCFRVKERQHAASIGQPPTRRTARFRFRADICWEDDFNVFVNRMLDEYPGGFVSLLFQTYVGPENTWMDFVGRQENLPRDLMKALHLAEQPVRGNSMRRMSPKNVCAGDPELGSLAAATPATIARVAEKERWVLETFYA